MNTETYNKRKKLWKSIIKQRDVVENARLSNAITNWYKANDDKVFKGDNGFAFIKNEVFGSSDEVFYSLNNSLKQYL